MKPVRSVTKRLGIAVGAARRRGLSAQGRNLGVLRMPEIASNLNRGARLERSLLRLLDIDLSGTDKGVRQPGRVHADGLIADAIIVRCFVGGIRSTDGCWELGG